MEYILLGFDSFIVSVLYYYYKKKTKILLNIKNAPEVSLSSMSDNEIIEYGMISGRVKSDSFELSSNFNPDIKGVIRVLEIREHGTTWNKNISTETKKLLSRITNDIPFSLINNNSKIHVDQALKADYLLDFLDLTYSKFDPVNHSSVTKLLLDLMAKDTIRGVETTEKMLRTGSNLIAFGRIEKLSTKTSAWLPGSTTFQDYSLTKPSLKGNYEFILTPLSRTDLIDRLNSTSKILKICLFLFTSIGIGLAGYCAYNYIKEYLDKKKRETQLTQARQLRLKNRSQMNNNNQSLNERERNNINQDQNSCCVVCLINPRELILLDCGHVCLCMDCFEHLPNSICPICRQRYRTFMPCYLP